ncbi:MAG: D-2-hydroxyacid dehydrogenase [Candidatus Acidiferrales bacterium]
MKRPAAAETKLVICAPGRTSFWQPPREMADAIHARWPEMRVVFLPDAKDLPQEIADTDIYCGVTLRPEQFRIAEKIIWVHSFPASVSAFMFPELRASGIAMTNGRGVQGIPMAEHILGMLIALARRFPDCFRYQQQAHWAQHDLWEGARKETLLRELRGQVLLCIGFGAIGREVARIAQPLAMHIHAVTRSGGGDTALAEKFFTVDRLPEALAEADFVLLAAPETPETHAMMGAREFSSMKNSAYFLNVSRGSLVDEPALIAALQKNAIAGAALDVTSQEPLPPENPLWRLDNVFITPHVSALSSQLWDRQTDLLLQNLEAWFGGRELTNRVDLARGY